MIRLGVLLVAMIFLCSSLYAEVIPVRLPSDSPPQDSDQSTVAHRPDVEVHTGELSCVYVVGQVKSFWYETVIGLIVLSSIVYILYTQARK